MKANLIGERSAGMTAVEIYNDRNVLVWSHMWFEDGASRNGYIYGLCDALDAMRLCADADGYEGCDVDEDGAPVQYDTNDDTGVMLTYDTALGWSLGDDAATLGQSREIVDACMIVGLVEPDEQHAEYADAVDPDVVAAIVEHIGSQS